jgi:hypothetical protein
MKTHSKLVFYYRLLLVMRRIVDVFKFSREANGKSGQTALDRLPRYGHVAYYYRWLETSVATRTQSLQPCMSTAENRGRFRVFT